MATLTSKPVHSSCTLLVEATVATRFTMTDSSLIPEWEDWSGRLRVYSFKGSKDGCRNHFPLVYPRCPKYTHFAITPRQNKRLASSSPEPNLLCTQGNRLMLRARQQHTIYAHSTYLSVSIVVNQVLRREDEPALLPVGGREGAFVLGSLRHKCLLQHLLVLPRHDGAFLYPPLCSSIP